MVRSPFGLVATPAPVFEIEMKEIAKKRDLGLGRSLREIRLHLRRLAGEPLVLELVANHVDPLQVSGREIRVQNGAGIHPAVSWSQMARISLSLRSTVRVEVPRTALISSIE